MCFTQYLYIIKYKFEESKVENLWFSSLLIVFYSIAVSFLSVYVYTPSGRKTTISAQIPLVLGRRFRLTHFAIISLDNMTLESNCLTDYFY